MDQGLNPEEYRNKFLSMNCMHCLSSLFYFKGVVEPISLILNKNYKHQALLLIVHNENSQNL